MINYFGGILSHTKEGEGKELLFTTKLISKDHYEVVGDFSSAAFLIVAGLIAKESKS